MTKICKHNNKNCFFVCKTIVVLKEEIFVDMLNLSHLRWSCKGEKLMLFSFSVNSELTNRLKGTTLVLKLFCLDKKKNIYMCNIQWLTTFKLEVIFFKKNYILYFFVIIIFQNN